MCSEFERVERVVQKDVWQEETVRIPRAMVVGEHAHYRNAGPESLSLQHH